MNKNENLIPDICKVYYSLLYYVNNVTVDDDTATVSFQTGKGWNEMYLTAGTVQLSQKQQSKASGEIFQQKLQGFFPGMDTGNVSDFSSLEGLPMLIRIDTCNGDHYLLGTMENPVKLLESLSLNDQKGRQLSFERIGNRLLLLNI